VGSDPNNSSVNYQFHGAESFLKSYLANQEFPRLLWKLKVYYRVHKILPVVLYEFENWSLALREEHRLRVLQNRVLRRIFGPKRNEVTGEWRKLRNEELHILYLSPNIIRQIKSRRIGWAGHVAHMGGEETVQGFGGKA
jgi:hypothetical protein